MKWVFYLESLIYLIALRYTQNETRYLTCLQFSLRQSPANARHGWGSSPEPETCGWQKPNDWRRCKVGVSSQNWVCIHLKGRVSEGGRAKQENLPSTEGAVLLRAGAGPVKILCFIRVSMRVAGTTWLSSAAFSGLVVKLDQK